MAEGAVFDENVSSVLVDNTITRKKIGHNLDRHITRAKLNRNEMTSLDYMTDVKRNCTLAKYSNYRHYDVATAAITAAVATTTG